MMLVNLYIPSDVGADEIRTQNHGGPGSLPVLEVAVANATGRQRSATAHLWRQHRYWYFGHPIREAASSPSRPRRKTASTSGD